MVKIIYIFITATFFVVIFNNNFVHSDSVNKIQELDIQVDLGRLIPKELAIKYIKDVFIRGVHPDDNSIRILFDEQAVYKSFYYNDLCLRLYVNKYPKVTSFADSYNVLVLTKSGSEEVLHSDNLKEEYARKIALALISLGVTKCKGKIKTTKKYLLFD